MSTVVADRPVNQRLTDTEWRPSATTTTLPSRAVLSSEIRNYQTMQYPFSGGALLVTIGGSPPAWVGPTVESIGSLLSLQNNWDSYGAPSIDPRFVASALALVLDTLLEQTPAPSVVPTSRGGIQFEWHTRGMDVEVEFLTPSRFRVYCENQGTGQSFESEISRDLTPLINAINAISR